MRESRLFVFALTLGLACCWGKMACGGVLVGTFDVARGGVSSLDGGELTSMARNAILTNYDATIVANSTLTPEFLSGVDVLVLCNVYDGIDGGEPLSPSEQASLWDFVVSGGRLVLSVDGYSEVANAQAMLAPFGMALDSSIVSGILDLTILEPLHPIFNGPFGSPPPVELSGAGGLASVGPYATVLATMTANNLPVMVTIEAGALGPNSGRVFVVSDASPFGDTELPGEVPRGEALFLNVMEYVITPVPEPSGAILAGVGIALWCAYAYRRRS